MQDDILWSILAALAAREKNLYAAEIAYGALDEVFFHLVQFFQAEKVLYLGATREEADAGVRAAKLSLFVGATRDAEAQLLQEGHTFQTIMTLLSLCQWRR